MRARLPKIPTISFNIALLALALLAIVVLAGLHRSIQSTSKMFPISSPAQVTMSRANTAVADAPLAGVAMPAAVAGGREVGQPGGPRLVPPPPRGSRGPSQLIRTANLSLEVTDVTKALRTATSLTNAQLGDVIGLNDDNPASEDAVHTATMQIRVPQYRFEQMLDALGSLGKVKQKSVNAQDVSDQIVDAQARLRNLRRTEADILKIMDRSGNIEQVLNVTQQLGGVREEIERLDAQIQGMRYQVAYSTVNITFSSPAAVTTPTGFAVLAQAWKNALSSLRDVTVSLLSLGLWLLAFSPYIVVVALLVIFALARLRAHSLSTRGT
ncbi:MAG: DUF4349 domain-containing protein [Candidatus Eremiobacteraeota bacterium]|nr:DUF4349 domain-containing protein [Candidatus Eremiobacteraeota bacterium]